MMPIGDKRSVVICAVACAITLWSVSAHADGVIDIKVNPASTFVINTAGSYRLVSNVQMNSDIVAISITAADVILDLGGHTINGTGAGGNANGIVSNTVARVKVFNGSVLSFGGAGVYTGGNSEVKNVLAHGNGGYGIRTGSECRVLDCEVYSNGADGFAGGIYVLNNSVVQGCNVVGNSNAVASSVAYGILTDAGCRVEGNTSTANNATGASGSGYGIYLAGSGCIALNNVSRGNTGGANGSGYGIYVGSTNTTVKNNTTTLNTATSGNGYGYGIYLFGNANTAEGNVCSDNDGVGFGAGIGIWSIGSYQRIIGNQCHENDGGETSGNGYGLSGSSHSEVSNNVCTNNRGGSPNGTGIGISAVSYCTLRNNHVATNTALGTGFSYGITLATGNRIEGNHVIGHTSPSGTSYGIVVSGTNNLVIGNLTSLSGTAGIRMSSASGGNRVESNRMSDTTAYSEAVANELGANDLVNEPF